jgi:hypothetical protein
MAPKLEGVKNSKKNITKYYKSQFSNTPKKIPWMLLLELKDDLQNFR